MRFSNLWKNSKNKGTLKSKPLNGLFFILLGIVLPLLEKWQFGIQKNRCPPYLKLHPLFGHTQKKQKYDVDKLHYSTEYKNVSLYFLLLLCKKLLCRTPSTTVEHRRTPSDMAEQLNATYMKYLQSGFCQVSISIVRTSPSARFLHT
jgi:hypothetical protein